MDELIGCKLLEEMPMYLRLRAMRQGYIDPEKEMKNPQNTVEKSVNENSKEIIDRRGIVTIKKVGPCIYVQIFKLTIYKKIRKGYDTYAYLLGIPIAGLVRRERIKTYYILGIPVKKREWTDALNEQDLEDLKKQILRLKQMESRM